jgi:hypothetical protein
MTNKVITAKRATVLSRGCLDLAMAVLMVDRDIIGFLHCGWIGRG